MVGREVSGKDAEVKVEKWLVEKQVLRVDGKGENLDKSLNGQAFYSPET